MSLQFANISPIVDRTLSAEKVLSAYSEHFPALLFLYDREGQTIQFNEAQVAGQLGYGAVLPAEKGSGIELLVHLEDRSLFLDFLREGPQTSGVLQCRFGNAGGQYSRYTLQSASHQETDRHLIFAFPEGRLPNVSERPDELRATTREAEQLLKYGTFEFEAETGLFSCSEGLYELLGYDSSLSMDLDLLVSYIEKADQQRFREDLAGNGSAGPVNAEYRLSGRDGETKVIQVIARVHSGSATGSVRCHGIIRDITHKRNQEEILNKAIVDLRRSNRELEEFAYIASHDLQEPLRKISTFSSLLSEKLGGEIREDANLFLKRIIASADSMRTLIDHLLEFSRITRTNEPFRPTSLSFVLQEVRNELELKIEETGASIEASALPTIQASVMQMKQLFSNILGNAIKFRKPDVPPVIRIGHAELSTSEKREYGLKAEKRYFIIKVSDNGIGFDEAYASRIFQIFQRLHGKTEYPGSGIGLAICKRIADNHHGLIFAESAGNQGACFTVILPES